MLCIKYISQKTKNNKPETVLEVVASSLRQENEMKGIHIRSKTISISGDMIFYMEILKKIYKVYPGTNKQVQEGLRIQDQHIKINCTSKCQQRMHGQLRLKIRYSLLLLKYFYSENQANHIQDCILKTMKH